MLKHGLVLFALLFFTKGIVSQSLQPVRLEVPSEINPDNFQVELLGREGALIFYESNEMADDDQRKWFFGLFNTSLKQQWLKFIPLTDKLEYVKSVSGNNKLFLLFRNTTKARGEDAYYEIVTYNTMSKAFTKVTGTFPAKAEIAGFEAIGNTGCIALNIRREETDLLFIDLITGDLSPVHVLEDVSGYIFKLQADRNRKKFYLAMKIISDNRYVIDKFFQFSWNGSQEQEYDIGRLDGLKSLSNYYFIPEKNGRLCIMGNYALITSKVNSFKDIIDDEDPKGVGMYYLQFDKGMKTSLKFYDFLSFDNIYGSLKGRKTEYSKTANLSKEGTQKELKAYYQFIEPRVIKVDGQYIFSVEVYKPYYSTETRMEYDFYGRPMPYSYNIFGGYDFYDVIVVGLSEEGDLIWNNDFGINDLRTYDLRRQSIVFNDDEFISIAYVNKGKIFIQTIEGPVDIGAAVTDIETKLSKDRISDDQFNQIKHWYDDYFLVYGYQKLKNRTLDDKSVRTAFYVNKLAYK